MSQLLSRGVRMPAGFRGPWRSLCLLAVLLLMLAPGRGEAAAARAAASRPGQARPSGTFAQARAGAATPTATPTARPKAATATPTTRPTATPTVTPTISAAAATTATLSLSFDLSAVSVGDALGELAFPAGTGQAILAPDTCQDFRDFSFAEPVALGDGYAARRTGKPWTPDASSGRLDAENARDGLPVWQEGPGFLLCGLAPGEPVRVTVFAPDGKAIFTRDGLPEPVHDDPPNACPYPTTGLPQDFCYLVDAPEGLDILPWESTGAYRVEAVQDAGRFTKTFDVVESSSPGIYYSDRAAGYVLSGFEPSEQVKIVRYEGMTPVGAAPLRLDGRGMGLLLSPRLGAAATLTAVRADFSIISYGDTYGFGTIDFDQVIRQDPTNARAYLRRGLARLDESQGETRPVLALQDFTQAIALDPGFMEAYSERARTQRSIDDTAGAIASLSRALEVDPEYAPAYRQRADLYSEQKQWPQAAADLTALLALQPADRAGIYQARAMAYEAAGENARAIADTRAAIAAAPERVWVYFRLARLIDTVAAAGAAGDSRAVAAAYEQAIQQAVARDAVAASGGLEDYTRLVELEPDAAFAWYARGLKGAGEESVADLDRAIALAPDFVDAYRARAAKLSYLDLALAIPAYARLLQFEPANLAAYRDKAILEEAAGDTAAAVLDYEQSYPFSPQAHQLAARAAESRGDVAQAIAEYSALIEAMPNFLPALYHRGRLSEQAGDAAQARADYTRIIEVAPDDAQTALYARARLYYRYGESELAAADMRQALTLDGRPGTFYGTSDDYDLGVALLPDSPLPAFRRAEFAHEAKQPDEAVLADVGAALAVDPAYVPALKLRGQILADGDDKEATIAAFTALIAALEAAADAGSARDRYDAYATRALLYKNVGDSAEAIADYTSAIELGSANGFLRGYERTAHYAARAALYEAAGAYERAIADYEQLIAGGSTSPWRYRYRLAGLYDTIGDPARALAAYREIIDGRHLDEVTLTLDDCARLVELAPEYAPAYLCRGQARYDQGAYEEAVADLTTALALGLEQELPGSESALRLRGQAYDGLQDYGRAIEDYTAELDRIRALERDLDADLSGDSDTDVAGLLLARGKDYYMTAAYRAAIADLSRAAALAPNWADGRYELARSYDALGDADNARAVLVGASERFNSALAGFTADDYDWFVGLAPDYGPAYLYRGAYRFAQEEYVPAVLDFTRALELGLKQGLPTETSAYRLRGRAYYALYEYDRAVDDFSAELDRLAALKQSGGDGYYVSPAVFAELHTWRGNAHYMARRYEDAIADYTAAIENQPRAAYLYANRGNAYFNLGEYALAADDFSLAIDLNPSGDQHRYYGWRGDAYYRLGDAEKALADYEIFVANTDDPAAKAAVQAIIEGLK